WHGANWTFVIWGALHGFFVVAGTATRAWRDALWRASRLGILRPAVARFITFQLVALAWVFFRAPSVSESVAVLEGLWRRFEIGPWQDMGLYGVEFALACGLTLFVLLMEWAQK